VQSDQKSDRKPDFKSDCLANDSTIHHADYRADWFTHRTSKCHTNCPADSVSNDAAVRVAKCVPFGNAKCGAHASSYSSPYRSSVGRAERASHREPVMHSNRRTNLPADPGAYDQPVRSANTLSDCVTHAGTNLQSDREPDACTGYRSHGCSVSISERRAHCESERESEQPAHGCAYHHAHGKPFRSAVGSANCDPDRCAQCVSNY
jgi:hypothetical protein